MGSMEDLIARGNQTGGGMQSLLSAPEAERMIEQLVAFNLEDVGSAKWHTQHEWLNQLNTQAHYNAQTHSDEFVMELFVSLDRIRVLVHDLLVIEVWKEKVLPLLRKHMAENVNTLVWYSVLLHEGVVANLLEVVLYHHQALEAIPEDYLLELADWCYRKLLYLNTDAHKHTDLRTRERSVKEMMGLSKEEEMKEKQDEVDFGSGMASLGILRYLSDHIANLSMGLLGRMCSTHDIIMALLPLLDSAPWVCRRPKGQLEKYIGNRWVAVPPAERIKLTQHDGQVWLTLHNLLLEPRCRAKYFPLDDFRKERLLGLKRWMNEVLIDQLPVLKDLQRLLDELALGVLHGGYQNKNAALILEQVPVIRESLLRNRDWQVLALEQARGHFGEGSKQVAQERMEQMLKTFEYLADMEAGGKEAASGGADSAATSSMSASSAGVGPVRVECWRKAHETTKTGAIWENWTNFTMELDLSKPPDPVEVADGGVSVHGLRYRLMNIDIASSKALPSNGKISVRTTVSAAVTTPDAAPPRLAADALLQLPEIPTKDSASEKPAMIWVTVGLLATDGVVLQLKLKRTDKLKDRDSAAGCWYAYHPVGGALTVLRDISTTSGPGSQTAPEAIPGYNKAKPSPAKGIMPISEPPKMVALSSGAAAAADISTPAKPGQASSAPTKPGQASSAQAKPEAPLEQPKVKVVEEKAVAPELSSSKEAAEKLAEQLEYSELDLPD